MEKAVLKPCSGHFKSVSQNKTAHEPASCYASVEVGLVFTGSFTLACNRHLAAFERNREIIRREAGHREGDANIAVSALFDIIGRVALGSSLCGPVYQGSGLVKSQEKGTVEQNCTCRHMSVQELATAVRLSP